MFHLENYIHFQFLFQLKKILIIIFKIRHRTKCLSMCISSWMWWQYQINFSLYDYLSIRKCASKFSLVCDIFFIILWRVSMVCLLIKKYFFVLFHLYCQKLDIHYLPFLWYRRNKSFFCIFAYSIKILYIFYQKLLYNMKFHVFTHAHTYYALFTHLSILYVYIWVEKKERER